VGFVGKPLQIGTTCAALTTLRHYLCSINYAKLWIEFIAQKKGQSEKYGIIEVI
jgi:hypothetical protein